MDHNSILGSFTWSEVQVQPNQPDNILYSYMHLFDETIPYADMINNIRIQHGCFHIYFNGLWPMGTDINFVIFSVPYLKTLLKHIR